MTASKQSMRSFLTLAFAVLLFGLPSLSSQACPFVTASAGHEKPCSHCPKENKRCPVSTCLLGCPYEAGKTAVVVTGGASDAPLLAGPYTVTVPLLALQRASIPSAPQRLDPRRLYLLNRVLLI